MSSDEKLQWFTNRYRIPFHRRAILTRKETLLGKKGEKFGPMGVSDLYDLLRKMGVSPRKIPSILSCLEVIPGDYRSKFSNMLDLYHAERASWTNELKNQKRRLHELDTMPWSSSSPRGLRERELEMQEVIHIINDLETKLNGLPASNTYEAVELYRLQTNEELESDGIITAIDGPYPRFTKEGLEAYKVMESMYRLAASRLRGQFPIKEEAELRELSLEIWKAVKEAHVGN